MANGDVSPSQMKSLFGDKSDCQFIQKLDQNIKEVKH